MAKFQGAIVVDIEKCKGCGVCIEACPSDVINKHKNVNSRGYNYTYAEKPEECTGCANCAIVCPDGVIKVYKKRTDK